MVFVCELSTLFIVKSKNWTLFSFSTSTVNVTLGRKELMKSLKIPCYLSVQLKQAMVSSTYLYIHMNFVIGWLWWLFDTISSVNNSAGKRLIGLLIMKSSLQLYVTLDPGASLVHSAVRVHIHVSTKDQICQISHYLLVLQGP